MLQNREMYLKYNNCLRITSFEIKIQEFSTKGKNVKNNVKLTVQAVVAAICALPVISMAACGNNTNAGTCSGQIDNFNSAAQNMNRNMFSLVAGKVTTKTKIGKANAPQTYASLKIGDSKNANQESGDSYGFSLGRFTDEKLTTQENATTGFLFDYNDFDFKSENITQWGVMGYYKAEADWGQRGKVSLVGSVDFSDTDISSTSGNGDFQTKGYGFGISASSTYGAITPTFGISYSYHRDNNKLSASTNAAKTRGELNMLKAGFNVGIELSQSMVINAGLNYNNVLNEETSIQDHHFMDIDISMDMIISNNFSLNAGLSSMLEYSAVSSTATKADIEFDVIYVGSMFKF
jgi:hypothetical protein